MAPQKMPACGFAVEGTKKGELTLRTEKRAKGKKVTIIPNVQGEAMKLARTLQGMLGVGGTARQAEKGSWIVEVQGDQIARVTQALLRFDCLVGLSRTALEELKNQHTSGRPETVVARSTTSKYLAQTQDGARLSLQEERRRALEQEAEFYVHFWGTAEASDDFSDVWDETLAGQSDPATSSTDTPRGKQGFEELNIALRALGMLSDTGKAVAEFWKSSGMTVSQFRKMALNPGARLLSDGPGRIKAPSNLVSRQKMSDFRTGGSRGSYFTPTVSAIDDYERGVTRQKLQDESPPEEVEEARTKLETDADGWSTATMSHRPCLTIPPTRLDDVERTAVAHKALVELFAEMQEDIAKLIEAIPGLLCDIEKNIFAVALRIHEEAVVQPGKRSAAGGSSASKDDKEEMRLEKKLREISTLKRKQGAGETLEKLQMEKIQKKDEVFLEVAEMKIARAEKELARLFKKHISHFKDIFWKLEWPALYGDDSESTTASGGASSRARPFGIFDEASAGSRVVVAEDATVIECKAPAQAWGGARLLVRVKHGEVAAYAIEVIEGLLRVGWTAPYDESLPAAEIGQDERSFGFGGTGKKVHNNNFESYGLAFKAGDVIHCEAERDEGRLRIGFAKNSEPLGVAFDLDDTLGDSDLVGAICGKGAFKARIVSAESMPLEEAPLECAELPNYVEYDPPRSVEALADFKDESELADSYLQFYAGDFFNVSADDGEGYLFGFFLDPDDGGWFPAHAVRFLDEDTEWGVAPTAADEWAAAPPSDDWGQAPCDSSKEKLNPNDDWGAPPSAVASTWQEVQSNAGHQSTSAATGLDEAAKFAAQIAPPARASVALNSSPATGPCRSCPVVGLEEWLTELTLQRYQDKAVAWCREMGAVSIEEVEECWEEFADQLALKPLERKRLAKKVAR